MNSKRIKFGLLILNIVVIGLLFITLGPLEGIFSVKAAEPPAANMAAVTGGPGFLMIPAVAFLPESPTNDYLIFWGDLSVPLTSPNPYSRFYAPVYLPQGAQLTGLTLFFHDTTVDGNSLGVDFYRKPLPSSSSGENLGLSVYSNQTGWGIYQSDTTPDPACAVIDNSQYAYWLSVYIYKAPAYLQLQAVRIDYTYNANLPVVLR